MDCSERLDALLLDAIDARAAADQLARAAASWYRPRLAVIHPGRSHVLTGVTRGPRTTRYPAPADDGASTGESRSRRGPGVPGRILVILMVGLVAVAAWHALGTGSAAAESNLPDGWVSTPYGPLSPADTDFLVRVRQAGLWEMPAGEMAQTQAESNTVKTVGATLKADHHLLDDQVRKLAGQLSVTLPAEPNKDQQGWLAEMRVQYGSAFDQTFANRLRAAHGKVFTVVSGVRAGTRNDLIRGFAQTAVEVVMKHMTLLESIGNVDYNALPPPPLANGTGAAQGPESHRFLSGSRGALAFLGLAAVLLLATVLSRRSRPRRRLAAR